MGDGSDKESMQLIIPMVIEETPYGGRGIDIYSLLLKERIVLLGTPIDAFAANSIIAQLLHLDRADKETDVYLFINSPGGLITAGLAIYDTMQLVRPDIITVAVGSTASMATVLLAAGTKGKRYALPNATVHMHQAMGGAHGQASDIEIAAKEIMRLNKLIREILVRHSGQTMKVIERDTDRDSFMTSEQAKAYGLIDEIMTSAKDFK